MPEAPGQLSLFVLFAMQTAHHRRELTHLETGRRRDVAMAIGQIGNQLALALVRGDDLARSVRRAPLCADCRANLEPALDRFDHAPQGRGRPPARLLPVLGSVT